MTHKTKDRAKLKTGGELGRYSSNKPGYKASMIVITTTCVIEFGEC